MIPKYDDEDLINNLTNPIYSIMQQTQYQVLSVITNRVRNIGKLSATDAQRLSQLIRMEDLDTIESIIASGSNLSVKEIDSIIEQAATNNDNLAEKYYKHRNMPPSNFMTDMSLLNVVEQAKKSMVDGVVNLSKTTGFVFNGKMTDTAKVYNYAVNKAVFEVQQGLFDYNTVMRSTITQLASSGLRTVDYESGYSRRLDSSVRMAVSDGVRGLNVAYRDIQGSQFGADGIELSAHAMSEPIHGLYQGKQFTKKEFEQLQGSLERPFFTMNCRHSSFPIIMGLSKQAYSDDELDQYEKNSRQEVEYSTLQKDSDGKVIKNSLSRYDASQKLRQVETNIRQLKDVRNQLELNNDTVGVAEYDRKIKAKTAYYKKIANEIGLKPQLDRLRVYSGKSTRQNITNVSPKKTEAYKKFSFPKSNYNDFKTIEDCEKFATKFTSNGVPVLSKKSIDFSGLDIEQSNTLCKTMNNIFGNTKIDKPSSIEVFGKKNRKYYEKHENAPMATTNFGNLLINKEICKTDLGIVSYLDEGKSAFDLCIKNKSRFSGSKLELIERYEKAGKQLVGDSFEDMIVHETGHLLSYSKEFNKPLAEIMNNTKWMEYAENLSGYSSHSFGEYIAESWSSFYKYGEDNLQPEILDIFKKAVI